MTPIQDLMELEKLSSNIIDIINQKKKSVQTFFLTHKSSDEEKLCINKIGKLSFSSSCKKGMKITSWLDVFKIASLFLHKITCICLFIILPPTTELRAVVCSLREIKFVTGNSEFFSSFCLREGKRENRPKKRFFISLWKQIDRISWLRDKRIQKTTKNELLLLCHAFNPTNPPQSYWGQNRSIHYWGFPIKWQFNSFLIVAQFTSIHLFFGPSTYSSRIHTIRTDLMAGVTNE